MLRREISGKELPALLAEKSQINSKILNIYRNGKRNRRLR